nr:T9SS type A sorting domain-containing protein [uncultured Psychroserpens sp.]
MKQFYALIIILFSSNLSFAQNEVLGDWYLYTINIDNTNFINQDIGIDYPNLRFVIDNAFSIFEGSVCNGYNGECIIGDSTIEIIDLVQLDGPCENEPFEQAYFYEILTEISDSSTNLLDYQITGIGMDQTLVITDITNSNYAVYNRQPQPTNVLGDWYLYSTTVDGLSLHNAEFSGGQPKIALTQTYGYQGLFYEGSNCNDFFGDYTFNIDGTITKIDFTETLNFCDNNNTDEFNFSYRYSVLNFVDTANFNYEIIANGDEETLILTNLENSNYATLGRTQQTPNMIGEWFLYYVVVDGNQTDRPEGSLPMIEFTTNIDSDGFYYGGIGVCTGYGGGYHFNPQQTFDTVYLNTTQGNSCNTNEENTFENLYFYSVLDNPDDNATELDYEIIGTGDDATLVVSNISNGNQAFYGRQTLSINENNFMSSKISLSKNPVSNSLEISTTQNLIGSNYEIFSITGQQITTGILNSNLISVNQLKSGLYFLKVFSENNGIQTIKFIKD